MQLTSDRRQRDVHDRAVQADNEQAHAANAQDEQATPTAQFGQADHLARSGSCPEYLRSRNYLSRATKGPPTLFPGPQPRQGDVGHGLPPAPAAIPLRGSWSWPAPTWGI